MADKTNKKKPTLTERVASLEELMKAQEMEIALLKDANKIQGQQLGQVTHLAQQINSRNQTLMGFIGKVIGLGAMQASAYEELMVELQPKVPTFSVVVVEERPEEHAEAFLPVTAVDIDGVRDIALTESKHLQQFSEEHRTELKEKVNALELAHGTVVYFALQRVGERALTLEESRAAVASAQQ